MGSGTVKAAVSQKVSQNEDVDSQNETVNSKNETIKQNVSQNVSQKLSDRILNMMRSNPNVTKNTMAEALGVNRRTIQREIQKLSNVHYWGSSKLGHWVIDE